MNMKSSFALLSAAPLLLCTSALHAQTEAVVYGRQTITFAPALLQTLTDAGATLTDLNNVPFTGGAFTQRAVGGALDMPSGSAEADYKGGYLVSAAGNTIRVQDFVDSVSGGNATITALFILNGQLYGRLPVFVSQGGPASPAQFSNGVLTETAVPLGLSSTFVSQINQLIGRQMFTANTLAATVDTYTVVTPFAPGVE